MTKAPGSSCNIKRFGGVSFGGFKDEAGACAPIAFGTSKDSLEAAGWGLKFTHADGDQEASAHKCTQNTYSPGWWGWSTGEPYPVGKGSDEAGMASFRFKGKGTATLKFGNCGSGGRVNVYFEGQKIASATRYQEEIVTFDFEDGNLLALKDEEGNAIVKISALDIACATVVYYRWDPRLRLLENTLEKPAQIPADTQASCPNVPRTFLNRDSCQRRDAGTCAPVVFQRGTMITLDEATVKAFYSEGNKHVHKIVDLRLEDEFVCGEGGGGCEYVGGGRVLSVCGKGPSRVDGLTLSYS